ncbi:hypothetical protein R1flu_017141 [Riccia fluitans]|uniref:Uncharacterized protein n=1 Tax=Riccia fluitans TaxID=41844 RepID=A0ABD1YPP1_9MARC
MTDLAVQQLIKDHITQEWVAFLQTIHVTARKEQGRKNQELAESLAAARWEVDLARQKLKQSQVTIKQATPVGDRIYRKMWKLQKDLSQTQDELQEAQAEVPPLVTTMWRKIITTNGSKSWSKIHFSRAEEYQLQGRMEQLNA